MAIFGLVWVLAHPAAHGAPGQSFEAARKHWAYQPLGNPVVPVVHSRGRVQSPVDAFLLARMEEKGLTFAAPADRRTLLRRVYYDLSGLPPTLEEIRAFERDSSPGAFAAVVDRLLASPRYGERWGRHWLDVARYADTKDLVLAYGKDALRPYAYTYRDYVIRAFNENLPFNQFVADQLSADLAGPSLPRWRLAALGFLTVGRLFDNNPNDQIDDQIDTTTRGFLGLTVACARCHDHKYDAITQKDYYGLYGVFASTEQPYDLPLLEDPRSVPGGVEFENQLSKARQELEQQIDGQFASLSENLRLRFGDYLFRAATTEPDITETTQFALSLTPEDFRPSLMLRTRRWLQRRATPADRVFGPWADLMELPDENFQKSAAETLNTCQSSEDGKPGRRFNDLVMSALRGSNLTNKTAVARVYAQLFRDAYAESKKPAAGSPSGGLSADEQELFEIIVGPDSPVKFARRDTPNLMSRPDKDRYNGLVASLDKIPANATNAPPARAMVVADLPEPYDAHVFKRGNPARPGEPAPRAFLQVLSSGHPQVFTNGSGRLELARAITAPGNPLTARVFVNRVWMLHFGEPLMGSTTDFGVRSDPPTHPELLDWLASEFIRSGWDIKHLHRIMLLTTAYQQASLEPTSASGGAASDPENKLLSHYSRRRLDFEALRDTLLCVSGRLDPTMGGRPFDPATEPLNPRRAVYALINRQDLPATFRAFDFPVPDQCLERRPHTTVPQQALFELNSPFVLKAAQDLAAAPEIAGAAEPAQRIEVMFARTLGRLPTETEISSAIQFIQAAGQDSVAHGLSAWEQFAQVLLISNEAVFLD